MGERHKPGADFSRMAAPGSIVRREGLPDPARLAGSGITTRETLDWLASERPSDLTLERAIDDPGLRREAEDAARSAQRELVRQLRAQFHAGSRKTRGDFETARAWRGEPMERNER